MWLLAQLSVVLGANVSPPMGFLHVLLAVTLPLALIRARAELAFEHRG